jgi:hypothetical protein
MSVKANSAGLAKRLACASLLAFGTGCAMPPLDEQPALTNQKGEFLKRQAIDGFVVGAHVVARRGGCLQDLTLLDHSKTQLVVVLHAEWDGTTFTSTKWRLNAGQSEMIYTPKDGQVLRDGRSAPDEAAAAQDALARVQAACDAVPNDQFPDGMGDGYGLLKRLKQELRSPDQKSDEQQPPTPQTSTRTRRLPLAVS